MSGWFERLSDFRLVDPDFDGTEVLKKFYTTGKIKYNGKSDMDKIRKDSAEFASDEDAKNFLTGSGQLAAPVPRK